MTRRTSTWLRKHDSLALPLRSSRILNKNRFIRLTGLALIASVLLASQPKSAHAGPWTKDLGHFYVKLNEGFFFSDSFIDASGRTVTGTDYLGITTSVYFEVGLWKGLQIQGLLPHTVGTNSFKDGTNTRRVGGSDMLLGLQAQIPVPIKLKLAARVEAKIPLYDIGKTTGTGLDNLFPALGDGQLDMTIWLAFGGGIPKLPVYAWGEVGYRFRTEAFIGEGPSDDRSFVDSIAWLGQVGWTFYKRMIVLVNFIGVMAVKSDPYTKSWITVGPALYLPVYKGLAIEANVDPIVYARNSAPGMSFAFGLSYAH
jgi:hypothetical protein